MGLLKEKLFGGIGSIFATAGAAGAFGVCHGACLAIIAFFAAFGITITFLPFAFLQEPRFFVPLTAIGVLSLAYSVFAFLKHRKCEVKKIEQ